MRAQLVAPWLALALMASTCHAAVYAHVDPVSGMTVLSNVQSARAAPAAAGGSAPAAFPRVSAERQKSMDGMRREILEAELDSERKALAEAAGQRAATDIVQRHVANVEALKRELAGVR